MISFSTGIPDMDSLLYAEGYGYAQLHFFCENGNIQLNIGNGRIMTAPGDTRWRYAK